MKEELNNLNCGRENELIAFLYGELDQQERAIFQRHMHECLLCCEQLAAFSNIRESVVAWRNESLAGVISHITQSPVTKDEPEGPSAVAALREFFNLSPLWMKGALAFASLLFCLFAVLAAARLRDKPSPPVVTNHPNQERSEEGLNVLVEQRVQDELQRIKASEKVSTTANVNTPSAPTPGKPSANRRQKLAPEQMARRPLSKAEREELAADLRLISGKDDGELDLLADRINQ